jgi:acylphosphatase
MKTVIVEGRVQGVGFRAFCYEIAERLETNCTAENLEDGSVRITIPEEKSKQFIEELRKSKPELAVITKITVE